MKKNVFISASLLMISMMGYSQDIFFEDFNSTPVGMTLPNGWVQYNVDGLTPAANLAPLIGSNGWSIVSNLTTASDHEAFSNSVHNPTGGTANDWTISPQIVIPATGGQLEFTTYNEGASKFKVYVSTASGNTVADFSALTPVINQSTGLVSGATNDFTYALSSFAGQTVRLAFQNVSDVGGVLLVDDVRVRNTIPNDAALTAVSLYRYAPINTNVPLGFSVKNVGTTPITAITINWNDGTDHSSVMSTNIAVGATVTLTHPTQVSSATVTEKNIVVSIDAVNGGVDPVTTNNNQNTVFNTVSQLSVKKPVIEEGTGTWCGWCPRGAVALEYMEDTYPNFIGIAAHNDDPMAVAAYDAALAFNGFPNGHVDRVALNVGASNEVFESNYNNRVNLVVPASITATSSGSGATVTIAASATFRSVFNDAANSYRLGVIISEDNVSGSASGYNQTNYYSSASQNIALDGAGHNWQNEPNPVPAASMEYDHVGRALVGGFSGQANSLPAAITDGQAVNYTFNYTVPGTSNRANMHATIVLIDQATGEIVNAEQISIATLGLEEASTIGMEVFPNPATEMVNVRFEGKGGRHLVTITDLSGRQMTSLEIENAIGASEIELPIAGFSAGNYLVTVSTNATSYTQHLIIQ